MTRKLITTLLAALAILAGGLINEAKAATTPHEIKDIIVKTAISMGVDPCLALSIAQQESNFQSHRKSPYGAVGVFQLMPSTAKKMGFDPYDINENIKGGLTYYQMMYKKFGSTDLALAAYNAGPGNVSKYNGVPPFSETKKFINIIQTNRKLYQNDPSVLKHAPVKKAAEPVKKEETAAQAPVEQKEANEPKAPETKEILTAQASQEAAVNMKDKEEAPLKPKHIFSDNDGAIIVPDEIIL